MIQVKKNNIMKKKYQQPEIWVEKLNAEYQVLAESPKPTNEMVRIQTQSDVEITYGGPGTQSARTNGSLWDEGDEE